MDAGLASLSMSRLGTSTFKLTEPTAAAALAWVLRRLYSPRHARHQLEQNPAFDDSEAEGRTTAGAAGQVDMDHVISCHSSRVWACYRACGEEQAAPADRCVRRYNLPMLRLHPLFSLTTLGCSRYSGEDGDHAAPVPVPAVGAGVGAGAGMRASL